MLAIVGWTESQKDAFLRAQFNAQHEAYQETYRGGDFLVILGNGQPIGRLYLARWEREIRIVDIALLPEYSNRGIGTRLLRQLQHEAHAAGTPVRIHVERFNPALRLYERLGFRLAEDKWLTASREGRRSYYTLAPGGRRRVRPRRQVRQEGRPLQDHGRRQDV